MQTPNQSARSAGRIAYLDALRALGCFLVIINHTYDYVSLQNVSSSVRTYAFFAMMFSNIAVPLFLMISGCTLLTKQDTIKKTLSRFVRIAVVLVVFSFVYEVHGVMTGRLPSLSIRHFLNAIYTWNISTAYWYLYAYAGILLMLPFLQKLAQAMQKQDFHFFFAVSVFFGGVWPLVVEYTPVSAYCAHFELPLFTAHIFYLMLGYYLHVYAAKPLPVMLCAAGLVIPPVVSAFVVERTFSAGGAYLFLDNVALLPVIVTALCVFSLTQQARPGGFVAAALALVGRCSFGVFLLSDLFIMAFTPALFAMRAALHPQAAVTLFQLLVLAASVAVTLALRRVPGLRRLL